MTFGHRCQAEPPRLSRGRRTRPQACACNEAEQRRVFRIAATNLCTAVKSEKPDLLPWAGMTIYILSNALCV